MGLSKHLVPSYLGTVLKHHMERSRIDDRKPSEANEFSKEMAQDMIRLLHWPTWFVSRKQNHYRHHSNVSVTVLRFATPVLDPYSGWTTSEQAGHSAHRSEPSAVSYSISTYASDIDALQNGHVPSADCRVCIVLEGGGAQSMERILCPEDVPVLNVVLNSGT